MYCNNCTTKFLGGYCFDCEVHIEELLLLIYNPIQDQIEQYIEQEEYKIWNKQTGKV